MLEIASKGRFLTILLVGLLSVFYAEVLAGASILWFFDPFGYIVLLPLYLFHLLLLFNIAVRFNRVSVRSFYFLGVIFGLYETWMTKVAWAGFVGGESVLGSFLGFDIVAFGIIVLFWHPFFSFIAPLITLRILIDYVGNDVSMNIYGLDEFRRNRLLSLFFLYFMAVLASGALSLNSGYNLAISLTGVLVSLFLVFLVFHVLRKKFIDDLSFESLILGKKGISVIFIYLVILYVLFFFGVRTEAIASPLTMGLTVLFYLIVITLIYLDKSNGYDKESLANVDRFFDIRYLFRFYSLIISLVIVFSVFSSVGFIILAFSFIIAVALGYLLFMYNLLITIILRFKKINQFLTKFNI